MILYPDSCALIKRYISERGIQEVIQLTSGARGIGVSSLTYVEVLVALSRRQREGQLTAQDARRVRARFRSEWRVLRKIRFTNRVASLATQLAKRNPLRTNDAVQLASCLTLAEDSPSPLTVTFATADERLWKIAQIEGLAVWPATQSDFDQFFK